MSNHKKRVVITGLGIVSCFGSDVQNYYESLLDGKSGVRPISTFDVQDYPTKIAAEVQDFEYDAYINKKQARRLDPFLKYAIVAAKKSIEDSFFTEGQLEKLNKNRCGVLIGSGMGGLSSFYENSVKISEGKGNKISPFFIPYVITNMASGLIAIDLGFMGPNYSISTACATANHSMIAAAKHIQNNEADLIITGGTESAVNYVGLSGFSACKALSKQNDEPEKASRPWDKNRDGFVIGDGAGAIVLESLEHAQARGAKIYAEYLGGGISCDAHHITELRPDGAGVALCLNNAFTDAGISVDDIDLINAHATSTPAGDMCEIAALKKTFKSPEKVRIQATKSMIGHCLGSAGAMEGIAIIKQIENGKIHPTINLDSPEDDLSFLTSKQVEEYQINKALSNSFGFGGHNSSVIFGKFTP